MRIHHNKISLQVPVPDLAKHHEWTFPLSVEDELKYDTANFGFIMLRNVRTPEHDQMWQESYKCIRQFYPNKIIIIDDNSICSSIIPLVNCEIINSEYPGCGELLPFYYLYKYRPFKKAVFIHDSVFIKQYINFSGEEVRFLWTFNHNVDGDIQKLISGLKNSDFVRQIYLNREKWYPCFGVMSIITLEVIDELNARFDIFNLLNLVKNREDRCSLEKLFACLCFLVQPNIKLPLFGDIYTQHQSKHTWQKYYSGNYHKGFPIVKVWCGR